MISAFEDSVPAASHICMSVEVCRSHDICTDTIKRYLYSSRTPYDFKAGYPTVKES